MPADWSKPGMKLLYYPESIAYNEGISLSDATTMFNKAQSDGIITYEGGVRSVLNVTGPELTKWRSEYSGPGISKGQSVDMKSLYGGGGFGGGSSYSAFGSGSSYGGLGGFGGSGSYGGLGGSSFSRFDGGSSFGGFGGGYNSYGL